MVSGSATATAFVCLHRQWWVRAPFELSFAHFTPPLPSLARPLLRFPRLALPLPPPLRVSCTLCLSERYVAKYVVSPPPPPPPPPPLPLCLGCMGSDASACRHTGRTSTTVLVVVLFPGACYCVLVLVWFWFRRWASLVSSPHENNRQHHHHHHNHHHHHFQLFTLDR